MKTVLSLIIIISVMDFREFQRLIGGNISEAYKAVDDSFKTDDNTHDIYFMASESYKFFYNTPAHYILISNDNNIVDSVTFYFHGIIDETFYNTFVNDFGAPSTIQVIENVETLSAGERTNDSFSQYLKKSFVETREGTFEEKPLYMIWNKKDYQIKILLKHKQNISEITFRLPKEEF